MKKFIAIILVLAFTLIPLSVSALIDLVNEDIKININKAAGTPVIDGKLDEDQMARNKAIIQSMTIEERRNPEILKASRKRRIADGSGTSIQEINALLKQFEQSKVMLKQFAGMGKRGRFA